jgi:hypothetical protein
MDALVNITSSITPRFAWQSAMGTQDPYWEQLRADPTFAFRWHHVHPHPNGCWFLEMAPSNPSGHITLRRPDQTRVQAHRHAYELIYGAIPVGARVLQVCRDPACIRPAHLVLRLRATVAEAPTPDQCNSVGGEEGTR